MVAITTPEDVANLPAGFVGLEADGTVVTRLIDGPGAVFRRAGVARNIWPENLALPITPLVPVPDDAPTVWAVRVEDPRFDGPIYISTREAAEQHAEAAAAEFGKRGMVASVVQCEAVRTPWRDAPAVVSAEG